MKLPFHFTKVVGRDFHIGKGRRKELFEWVVYRIKSFFSKTKLTLTRKLNEILKEIIRLGECPTFNLNKEEKSNGN